MPITQPDLGQNEAILQGQKRGNYETVEILRGYALNIGGPTYITSPIPVNNPVIAAVIRINIALTVGTGTGAITEGELLFTKAISFRSDKNEFFLKNVPGRGLYRLNQLEFGTQGQKDAIAASNGTYSQLYVLPFVDFSMRHPYDTVFDPQGRGYKSVELAITVGGVADLLGTVGTSSVTATADLEFVQMRETVVPAGIKPRYVREIGNVQPANLASQLFQDLERSPDLAYTSLLVQTANSATVGVPFTGTPANTTLTDISVETNNSYPIKSILYALLNYFNNYRVANAAWPAGYVYLDLLGYGRQEQDGSYLGALYSAKYGKLRINSTVGTLSTSQLSILYDSIRDLKP